VGKTAAQEVELGGGRQGGRKREKGKIKVKDAFTSRRSACIINEQLRGERNTRLSFKRNKSHPLARRRSDEAAASEITAGASVANRGTAKKVKLT